MKRLRFPLLGLLWPRRVRACRSRRAPAKRADRPRGHPCVPRSGTTALSPNGQWLAYRMSPLQGDSEVDPARRRAGDKEMKFPVGEGAGGAVTFSDDSAWAAITICADAAGGAGQHARAPAESDQRDDRQSRDRREDDGPEDPPLRVLRRDGGWIALHRYGPEAAAGAALPRRRRPPARRPVAAGEAAPAADAPRDTRAARRRTCILRDLKTGTELQHRQRLRVRVQQERPLPRARDRRAPIRPATASRSATCRPARSRRSRPTRRSTSGMAWTRRRRRAVVPQGQGRSSVSRAAVRRRRLHRLRRSARRRSADVRPGEGQDVSGGHVRSAATARRSGPRAATRSSSASRR